MANAKALMVESITLIQPDGKRVVAPASVTSETHGHNPRFEFRKGTHVYCGYELVGSLVTMPVKTAPATAPTDLKNFKLGELEALVAAAEQAKLMLAQMKVKKASK